MKRTIYFIISLLYFFPVQILRLYYKKSKNIYCVILYYHSIPAADLNKFKKQMEILKYFTVIVPASYNGPFDDNKRYSMVTFDDAFANVINNAVPELVKLKIPCTIFIPSGQIGKKPEWLSCSSHADEHEVISTINELLSVPENIVTYGSHTINHHNLTKLTGTEAMKEIIQSKEDLEKYLGKAIELFSFPHGAYNDLLLEYCKKAGYTSVFSITPELPYNTLEHYVKGRIKVDPGDTIFEFVLKILGAYSWKPFAYSIKYSIKKYLGRK